MGGKTPFPLFADEMHIFLGTPALGKASKKKICLYLNFVKMTLTPSPQPNQTQNIVVPPPFPFGNVQIQAKKCLEQFGFGLDIVQIWVDFCLPFGFF